MNLVRHKTLPVALKKLCHTPSHEAGLFFALADKNDLPGNIFFHANLDHMLKVGRVWVGKAGTDPQWRQLASMTDLPKFTGSWMDDFDGCATRLHVSPFMPQFFFVPCNSRGRKFFRRAK